MKPFDCYRHWILPLGLALAASCLGTPSLRAQMPDLLPDLRRDPQLPRDWTLPRATGFGDNPSSRSDRFVLFRMPTSTRRRARLPLRRPRTPTPVDSTGCKSRSGRTTRILIFGVQAIRAGWVITG
jgi:hypothetical protein